MKFPKFERVVYAKNALIEVVCQLRHPRLLAIEAELPVEFQRKVQSEFPLLSHSIISVPVIEGDSSDGSVAVPNGVPHVQNIYEFISKDQKTKVGLTSEFVALTTTDYRSWDAFRASLLAIFRHHAETYRPPHYSRIGLRYKDVVDRKDLGLENARWADLINPQLLGALANREQEGHVSNFESRAQISIDSGQLTLRSYLAQNGETGEIGFMIDSDFWDTGELGGDVEQIFPKLDALHEEAGAVFNWAISDDVRRALGSKAS